MPLGLAGQPTCLLVCLFIRLLVYLLTRLLDRMLARVGTGLHEVVGTVGGLGQSAVLYVALATLLGDDCDRQSVCRDAIPPFRQLECQA